MVTAFIRWTENRYRLALGLLLRRWATWTLAGSLVLGGEKCGLVYVDWELVLALATGVATVGVLMLEHRRANRLDEFAVDLAETVAQKADASELAAANERIAALEAMVHGQGQQSVPERLASLENGREWVEDAAGKIGELGERVSAIETRIDFKPITHTRRKDGKFASPSGDATCTDEERRR